MKLTHGLCFPMQLEVRVWGMDRVGKPFSQTARTLSISSRTARLAGIASPQQVGDVIGVQNGSQKARFKVLWVGASDTAEQGQIDIDCLDPGRCIWADALNGSSDNFGQGPKVLSPGAPPAENPPSTDGPPTAERRWYPRYRCSGGIKLSTENAGPPVWAKLSDIALGGCYAELLSPLPVQTSVEFSLQVDDLEIRGLGIVRTAHPSVGNGIAFTQMKVEDWRHLNEVIARLAGTTSSVPLLPTPASAEPGIPHPLQVLLELLEKKGVLSQDEFLTELRKVKPRFGGSEA